MYRIDRIWQIDGGVYIDLEIQNWLPKEVNGLPKKQERCLEDGMEGVWGFKRGQS